MSEARLATLTLHGRERGKYSRACPRHRPGPCCFLRTRPPRRPSAYQRLPRRAPPLGEEHLVIPRQCDEKPGLPCTRWRGSWISMSLLPTCPRGHSLTRPHLLSTSRAQESPVFPAPESGPWPTAFHFPLLRAREAGGTITRKGRKWRRRQSVSVHVLPFPARDERKGKSPN